MGEAVQLRNTPVLGGPAPRHAYRTAQKLAGFARCYAERTQGPKRPRRYLDVGCGNGFITEFVAPSFDQVFGVDIEHERLEDFRAHVAGKSGYEILCRSAGDLGFRDEFFSCVTCFEVLEHVTDVEEAAREIVRVCDRGGIVIVSVPHAWFPFENHGVRIGRHIFAGKIPLLPYVRPLHRKWSLARVFSSAELDGLFLAKGLRLLGTSYASPQFERAGTKEASWESRLAFLRGFLDRCENVPVLRVLTGVSILKAYQKIP